MNWKKVLTLVVNIIIFLGIIYLYVFQNKSNNKILNIPKSSCQTDFIKKVYDWDTVFWKKLWKIRILWIDTPEIYHEWWTKVKDYKFYACWEYWEKLAKEYLLNKNIKVCFDKNDNKTWWYGRILGYIFFTWENNQLTDFWKLLIKEWYAKVYKNANFIYKKEYLQLEKQAKNNKLWIWSQECIEKDKKFKELIKEKK